MGKTTSFILGEHAEAYLRAQVATGRYGSVSEVLRDALRLHERRERQRAALEAALREGEESGDPIDGEEAFAMLGAKHTWLTAGKAGK